MLFEIVTLFPETYETFFRIGLMGRAVSNNVIQYRTFNPRKHGHGNYRHVDDYPFGGGVGMLLRCDVMQKTMCDVTSSKVVLTSPRGSVFNQKLASQLAREDSICIVCGQYEGLDQRWIDAYVDMEISIGDYILNSGETPAKVMIESVARKCPGYMTKNESHELESFFEGLLEYDQFTRPDHCKSLKHHAKTSKRVVEPFHGNSIDNEKHKQKVIPCGGVPRVLTSGHKKEIQMWQKSNALFRTWERRPDLLMDYDLNKNHVSMLYTEIVNRFTSKRLIREK